MSELSGPISLSAPASSGALQVLRAVTASVAARVGLPFDAVDEIRVAVNEAGTMLLDLGGSDLHLEIDPTGPDLRIIVSTDAHDRTWPDPRAQRTWPWQVIVGLCDEAEAVIHGGRPSIRLLRQGLGAA